MIQKGRLTVSNFGSLLNCKRVTQSLLKQVLGQYDLSRVQAINCGITTKVSQRKFKQKTNLCVEKSGLWLHLSGLLHASPDRLVGRNALLEVKCPFTQRDFTIEAMSSDNFYIQKHPKTC